MPKKLTYNEIKKYIEENSKGTCTLLSTNYINSDTPLILQCQCGNIYQRTFKKIKLGRFLCKKCSDKNKSKLYSYELDEVKKIIKNNHCEYISGEYINNNSKLLLKCECGNEFYKDLNHFLRGQNRCPKCGNKELKKSKTKYSIDFVKETIKKDGYEVIDNKYISCDAPILCKCKNGHIFNLYFSDYLYRNRGCQQCSFLNHSGENHWNYKGGESEVLDYFRKNIKEWKVEVMKKYNNTCYLTNSKRDCVIHHLRGFNTIIKESCEELQIPLYNKIKDYKAEDWNDLKEKVLSKHTVSNGVLLQRKVHNKFHSLYGKGNNTKEQFNDFIDKYYPGKKKV